MTDTETPVPATPPGRIRRALRSRVVPPICLAVALGSAVWLGHDFGYDRGYDAGSAVADGMRASMLEQIEAQRAVDAERAALGYDWPDATPVSDLPDYVDRERAARAARLGIPFVYQERDGATPCHAYLRTPDGRVWVADDAERGGAGAMLGTFVEHWGCRTRQAAPR